MWDLSTASLLPVFLEKPGADSLKCSLQNSICRGLENFLTQSVYLRCSGIIGAWTISASGRKYQWDSAGNAAYKLVIRNIIALDSGGSGVGGCSFHCRSLLSPHWAVRGFVSHTIHHPLCADSTENIALQVIAQEPLQEGDNVTLKCVADGNPAPTSFNFHLKVAWTTSSLRERRSSPTNPSNSRQPPNATNRWAVLWSWRVRWWRWRTATPTPLWMWRETPRVNTSAPWSTTPRWKPPRRSWSNVRTKTCCKTWRSAIETLMYQQLNVVQWNERLKCKFCNYKYGQEWTLALWTQNVHFTLHGTNSCTALGPFCTAHNV